MVLGFFFCLDFVFLLLFVVLDWGFWVYCMVVVFFWRGGVFGFDYSFSKFSFLSHTFGLQILPTEPSGGIALGLSLNDFPNRK